MGDGGGLGKERLSCEMRESWNGVRVQQDEVKTMKNG